MKTDIASVLIASFCVVPSFAIGGDFKTEIITSAPVTINVPDAHFLQIHKFTQEGGSQRGVVTVTTDAGTANVLTASVIDSGASPPSSSDIQEFSGKITIAGPASVTVVPVSGATLFITYRKIAEPTPTPTPTATPTPTPTPTSTPTPIGMVVLEADIVTPGVILTTPSETKISMGPSGGHEKWDESRH
jgi:hypothetical protein